jgi:hypothetical protein
MAKTRTSVASRATAKIAYDVQAVKKAYKRTTLSKYGAKVAFSRAAKIIADGAREVKDVYKTALSKEGAKVAFNGAVRNLTKPSHLKANGAMGAFVAVFYTAGGLAFGKLTTGGVLAFAGVYVTTRILDESIRGSYKALKAEIEKKENISAEYAAPAPLRQPSATGPRTSRLRHSLHRQQ